MNRYKLPKSPEARERRHNAAYSIAALGILTLASCEVSQGPEFSSETTTYTVGSGEGLSHAVQDVDGIERINPYDAIDHVISLESNQEALSDGLQSGESIVIPVSVKK